MLIPPPKKISTMLPMLFTGTWCNRGGVSRLFHYLDDHIMVATSDPQLCPRFCDLLEATGPATGSAGLFDLSNLAPVFQKYYIFQAGLATVQNAQISMGLPDPWEHSSLYPCSNGSKLVSVESGCSRGSGLLAKTPDHNTHLREDESGLSGFLRYERGGSVNQSQSINQSK